MTRLTALAALLCLATPAGALTLSELRADPRWVCALYRARGDLLAEEVVRPRGLPAGTDAAPERVALLLREAERRGDRYATAALGWWKRADEAGCD
ncbi:hypothetical protein [Amaricoccus solimangrovi]|uniref:Uncharacterized protein n=1 Tax=Amaricoccus solimangrovi TaxID=2589815 RepID=A0A501WSC6_9RHOB|nr:hypothetical protein [Amaricoccus solimangrovi]TPE49911.1 hypothetical protein FJM51_13180 [Amaricoccus solimangrovi]